MPWCLGFGEPLFSLRRTPCEPATWRVLRRSARGRTAAVWPGPRGSWGDLKKGPLWSYGHEYQLELVISVG